MDCILSCLDWIDSHATGYNEQLMSLSMCINTVKGGYNELIKNIMDLTGEFTTFCQSIVLDKTIQQTTPIPSTDRDQQSSINNLHYPPGDKLHTPTWPVVEPPVAESPQAIQPPTMDSQLSNNEIVCQIVHPISHDLCHETQEFGTYHCQICHPANVPDESISRAHQHREEPPHHQMAPQHIEVMCHRSNLRMAPLPDDSSGLDKSDGSSWHWGRDRAGYWDDSSQHLRTPQNMQELSYPSMWIGGMAKANSIENYCYEFSLFTPPFFTITTICQIIKSQPVR
jgi:hypothetical protein